MSPILPYANCLFFILSFTGSKASEFAGRFLHMILAKQEAFKKGDYATALKDGFLSTDKALIYYPPYRDDGSGCTATTALFANNKVFVANAGDSRTVLGVKGIAKPLSFDHKPQHDGERSRIVNAGGFVGSDRVNGNLALSRALGDFDFKRDYFRIPEEQIVTALPDVISHEITPDDEFVVLACDGIWDCMNSQTVVEYVRRQIAMGFPLEVICENIMDHCISPSSDMSGIGCDNMTILIVGILNGKTEEEWREMITQRVANNDGPAASVEDVQPKSKIEASHSHGFESESDHIQDFFQGGSQKLTLQSLLSQNATITTSEDGSLVIKTSAAAASNFLKQNADELEVEDDDDDDDYEHDGDKETIESKDDKSATESEESKKN